MILRPTLRRLGLLVLGLVLAASAPAEAARHYIQGRVIDRNGNPVDRVIVALEPGNVQLVTDRNGEFLIDYLRATDGTRIRLARRTAYALELFKPGFHTQNLSVEYKKGPLVLETFTLREDSLKAEDDGQNLDPTLYNDPTHSSGANYEGQ